MNTFYGIVEDRNDPLKIGRVRVRVHGVHTDDKLLIASPDLPWSQVLLPTTAAALSGIGTQHGLVEGSTVVGFFRDKGKQDFVVTHSSAGLPHGGYKETITDELLKRDVEKGFNDPRKLTKDAYKGTPDGESPDQAPNRSHGLTLAMDTAPTFPDKIETEIGKAVEITEQELTDEHLPFYPLKPDGKTSDLGAYHTAQEDTNYDTMDLSKMTAPDWEGFVNDKLKEKLKTINEQPSVAKPVYPFNKTNMTESGHLLEVDDSKGAERLSWYHRSGTFTEWQPDGSSITRVNKDNYTLICKDDHVQIGGNVRISVFGDAKIAVKKDLYVGVAGDAKLEVLGEIDAVSKKKVQVTAPEISLSATEIKLNS
tara:strand:+ start:29 stop:1129 length:1101 start_codon:yes stop_codon:yes gene_type:complete